MSSLKDRLALARSRFDGTGAELAARIGVRPNTLSRWLQGHTRPSEAVVLKLATAAGVDPEWLLSGRGGPDGDGLPFTRMAAAAAPPLSDEEWQAGFSRGLQRVRTPSLGDVAPAPAVPLPAARLPGALVPVRGTAAGSLAGSMAMSGDAIGYAKRPSGLADVADAYALYVVNNSMADRYRPGDLVFVHPYRPYRRGDIVIVQTQNHDGADVLSYIKEYVGEDPGFITVLQYNKRATVKFAKAAVKSVHRVMTVNELYAV